MNIEILNIGDELLNGTSVNSNATWLAGRVVALGGKVVAVTMVGDDPEDMLAALKIAGSRAGLVIVTGGLGPTVDDRTREVTIRFFGGKLIPNLSEIERIRKLFAERGLPLTERNIDQGWVPDKAVALTNPVGTAPGMEFTHDGATWLFLPGVPAEMKTIFDGNIQRWFKPENTEGVFVSSEMVVVGVPESFVADCLCPWQEKLPENWSLAFLPSAGLVKIRLSCMHNDRVDALHQIHHALAMAMLLFPYDAFFTAGEDWNRYFSNLLKDHRITLSTAESCTGGYLSHRITTVPGSSDIFTGGVIAYHNRIKSSWLNVPDHILEKHGAVSEETVSIMAAEVRKKFGTTVGVAISGIAGPDGGTPEKPVGMVWIAVADEEQVVANMFLMGNDRMRNIEKSAVMAMKMVLNLLEKSAAITLPLPEGL